MSIKKGIFIFAFFNFKVDFLANFKSENQTGTTVGKPRKFYTIVEGVDFLFFPAQILHDALIIKIVFISLLDSAVKTLFSSSRLRVDNAAGERLFIA